MIHFQGKKSPRSWLFRFGVNFIIIYLDYTSMTYNILIAEDEKMMRNLLKKMISFKHNIVGEATNGEEAVEKYKELDPDLVLLDVKMPKMNGFEALSEIKNIDDSQKVIMSTGVDNHEDITGAMEVGADAYLVKPFNEEIVLSTIEEVME